MKRFLPLFFLAVFLETAYAQDFLFRDNTIKHKTGEVDIAVQYPTLYTQLGSEKSTDTGFAKSVTQQSSVVDSVNSWSYATIVSDLPNALKISRVEGPKQLENLILNASNHVVSDNSAAGAPALFQYLSSWNGFSNSNMLSLFIETYLFTGGANGSQCGHYATFDLSSGRSVDLRSYIADTTKLLAAAVEILSKDRKYPANATMEQTALFCELSALPMPRNMGLNKRGLVLYYNMYEIGPRYLGAISVTIPYTQLVDNSIIALPSTVLLARKSYYEGCSSK